MISKAAIALILEFEGLDQPWKWPGGASGITLGRGYDLGFSTPAQFHLDWNAHLTAGQRTRLARAIGARGPRARGMASEYRDIKITISAADEVFLRSTLPKWEPLTRKTFPGADTLPADAFGALVSLCFNRGTSVTGDSRREMLAIRNRIAAGGSVRSILDDVAAQIRAMKRLWVGKNLDGLLRRRDAEADLISRSA